MIDRRRAGVALLLALCACGSAAWAQALPAPLIPTPSAEPPSLLRVGAALLVVLALLLGIHAVLRRTSLAPGGGVLRLETRLPVTRGGHVAVVRVDGRRLLVGVTPASVNLITELGALPGAVERPAAGRFDHVLSGLLRRKGSAE